MPAAGDLKFCPFLTISESYEGEITDGDKSYCDDPDDRGSAGWIEVYGKDNPGCGMFYDCCARVIGVACMKESCMFYSSGVCAMGGGAPAEIPDVFKWVQEWLTWQDVDGDGRIYGKDWVLSDPPPALQNIPPAEE